MLFTFSVRLLNILIIVYFKFSNNLKVYLSWSDAGFVSSDYVYSYLLACLVIFVVENWA